MKVKLNPQQAASVRYADGPLLVLAGAGSGKTRVITHKIAALHERAGMPAAHIFAVTFTNKAAREMRSRLEPLLGAPVAAQVRVSTFHRLGLSILRQEAEQLGLRRAFSLIDGHDALQVVREIMRAELSPTAELIEQVQRQISNWKNRGLTPAAVAGGEAKDAFAAAAARVYPEYQRRLRARHSVDLDDLILMPTTLLATDAGARGRWRDRVAHLLVDEYQDTNGAQYELVRQLVGDRGALTVVGDDDQSIYAWRGAQPYNLRRLREDFPDLKLIKLEQNYRSCGRILRVANALIEHNRRDFEKSLWSDLGYGEAIDVTIGRNEEHEAERVISHMMHHRFSRRTRHADYAILYRSNHQSRILEQKLREMRIPYVLSGEMSFFDRAEIKDLLSYLRLVTNPSDDRAFLRIANTPRRGIGAGGLEKLSAFAAARDLALLPAIDVPELDACTGRRQLAALRRFARMMDDLTAASTDTDPVAFVVELLDTLDYEAWLRETEADEQSAQRRWTSVTDLIEWLRRLHRSDRGRDLVDLVATMGLLEMADRDEPDGDLDAVSLMTLHAAKGLEFPYVYITGVEEGILPHRTSVDEQTVDEERRLFYVGITRAQQRLTLSWARQRRRFGEVLDCAPSRFLDELPSDDLNWLDGGAADEQTRHATGQAYLENIRELLG